MLIICFTHNGCYFDIIVNRFKKGELDSSVTTFSVYWCENINLGDILEADLFLLLSLFFFPFSLKLCNFLAISSLTFIFKLAFI